MNKLTVKRCRIIFFLLLAGIFLFRLWFMTTVPLSGDESYHWQWSRRPAFGYYDHPGLTAYLILFFTRLFGRSTEFTVRFPALLMLTGTAVVCFFFAGSLVRSRGGTEIEAEKAGFLAGLLILVIPMFALLSMYISTDPPLIFFWTLTMYLLYRALETESWPAWIGTGLAMGLAMMSKFLVFLMIPAVLIFFLVSPRDRTWFRRPHAYVAAALALLVFSPFLWWNATHGWATFMFNFVYRQTGTGFAPKHIPEFVVGQALALSPGIFTAAVVGLQRSMRDRRNRPSLFLGLSSLVPLAYFLYVSFRRQVGMHWPAAAWIGLIIYLSYLWTNQSHTEEKAGMLKRLRTVSLVLCVIMTVLLHLLLHIPQKWVGPVCQIFGSKRAGSIEKDAAERYGWPEMGQWVSGTYDEMLAAQGEDRNGVFIICSQYGVASSIAFYTPGQIKTHLWSPRKAHGENYRFWDDYPSFKDMDAVYVTKGEWEAGGAIAKLQEHFRRVDQPERLPIIVDGQEVRSFFLIRCYEFNGIAPEF